MCCVNVLTRQYSSTYVCENVSYPENKYKKIKMIGQTNFSCSLHTFSSINLAHSLKLYVSVINGDFVNVFSGKIVYSKTWQSFDT